MDKIKKWQKAIYSWVIGPGLGRDKYMNVFFPLLLKSLPQGSVVVIDADGIWYLCQNPELFQVLKRFKTILTPNHRELAMLEKALNIQISPTIQKLIAQKKECEVQLFESELKFENFSLLVKGEVDVIFGKEKNFVVMTQGGMKRCGGVGDILAGAVACCSYWDNLYGPPLASMIIRNATRKAFEKEGRGLTAPNILAEITSVIKQMEGNSSVL